MVNERAPPKAPLQPSSSSDSNARRNTSPSPYDEDDIISAMNAMAPQAWASVRSSAQPGARDPFRPLNSSSSSSGNAAMGHTNVGAGHPSKMISSRKQQANVFIKQKSRPEHHIGPTRIRAPSPPRYQDRKPPPKPMFDSNFFTSSDVGMPTNKYGGEEVFYTDPNKASADLKELLEGGMDEEEEDEDTADAQDSQKKVVAKDDKEVVLSETKKGVVEGLNVKLLPHQVQGVEWMKGRELGPVKRGKVPKGGILADDMGLGKTLQTLSLILTNQKPHKEDKGWKKHFEGLEKTTLVVAPLSLIRQWESEIIDKIAKSHRLKVCVHHGPSRTKNFKELALYDVVVTTYQILVSEHGHSSPADNGLKAGCFGLHWWRVVLDEAHTIKNRNAKASKACYALRSEYRWCLSGTPMQNNLDELQSLVKFLRIKPYDDLKEWKAHIDQPLKNGKGHIAIRRLHSLLRCFMKRRTKEILKEAGALNPGGEPLKDGEVSSNGFRVTARNIVTVSSELTSAERRFYNRLQARADRSMEAMMGGKVSYASALTLLLRMRQACNHPKLVAGKLDKDALSTGVQKNQEVDVDDVADLFAGMGIASKNCSICGLELKDEDGNVARTTCSGCSEDIAYFNNKQVSSVKETKKKTKAKSKKAKKLVSGTNNSKSKRRPRNRQAVIDSDDEEDDNGSWLVPENERGTLRLGKAGGEGDENAEGGGDWIGAEDSEDSDDDDNENRTNLSSFIVDDEAARREDGYISANDAAAGSSDDDDSLLSIDAITRKMASQTLEDKPKSKAKPSASQSFSASSSGTESDESSDSGSDENDEDESDEDESGYNSHEDTWDTSRRGKDMPVVASAKVRELIKILRKEVDEHKFIVFSQFTSMLDIVEPFLENEGFEYTRYDGSMKNDDREASLNRLRKDKNTRILLCSLKCGSLGLNLTAATRVVIIEPFWNPFIEEQAIDRVHRLTQTVDVTVYKLTVQDTVEERIIELQEKKRLLAEQAIEGGMKKGALKLGLNEIIDLFKPTHHLDDASDHGSGIGDSRQVMRDTGSAMRRKAPASGLKRQESELYGRRW